MSRHPSGWATCALMVLAASGTWGCVTSSTAGASVVAPSNAVITAPAELLVNNGQPPPSTPMCMSGEPGCIETGWGPGWDRNRAIEGQVMLHRSAARLMSQAAVDRSVHPENAFSGPCRSYWELDEDLGSAPVGNCE